MYKFRISKVAPFWARNNENKPNKTIFTNWVNANMVDVQHLPVHFVSFHTLTINSKYNDIKYIEIKNTENSKDVRYYYIDAVEVDGGNNTFKYKGVIDVYASFTLPFITDNFNKEFIFMRQHRYEKKCLQVRDKYLDEVPKIYTSYYFKKLPFNKQRETWYGEHIGIRDNGDLLNANRYYVFKDGANGSYTFYPIVSITDKTEIFFKDALRWQKKSETIYTNGNNQVNIPDTLNKEIVDAYKQGLEVEYQHRKVWGKALNIQYNDWDPVKNVPYGTLPVDVKAKSSQWDHAGAGIKRARFEVFMLGNQVFHHRTPNTLSWDHGAQRTSVREFIKLKAVIYDTRIIWRSHKVRNSITGLEELRKKQENINKFLGIFYLPHLLTFDAKRINIKDDYLFFNINPMIDNIGLFKIFNYAVSNIEDRLNNPTYSTDYFLRYLDIKYFGNKINAEYRANDQHNIYLGGRLFFTDTANIISKSDDLISLDKSIINYPYQLPIGVDKYEQYVQANRNQTETGFNIARKNQALNIAKSVVGGVTGVVGAVGAAATGNIAGAITGAAKAGIGVGFEIAGQLNGLANQEAQIRAQYEQANNTMGSELQFSNIETAALMDYYNDSTGEQYEGVEVNELDENVLILMNNYIYLNGYLLPNKSTFSKKIVNNRAFNYIQLDATLLINQLNINFDDTKLSNDIYELVKTQLTNGIRIWNKIDEALPEYDPNVNWPDQPDYERPNIPEQQPPDEPVNWDYLIENNYDMNNNAFNELHNYLVLFDDTTIPSRSNSIQYDTFDKILNSDSSTISYLPQLNNSGTYIINFDFNNAGLRYTQINDLTLFEFQKSRSPEPLIKLIINIKNLSQAIKDKIGNRYGRVKDVNYSIFIYDETGAEVYKYEYK